MRRNALAPRVRMFLCLSFPDSPRLLCDPLTGLVAYPSFEAHLIGHLPTLAPFGLHAAVGDVDDLRGYITACHTEDRNLFGHLAGNDCMRRVGEATCRWADEVLVDWPFSICATFGGDEVIVAAAGLHYSVFIEAVADPVDRIGNAAPRSCSFACATTVPIDLASSPEDAYRRLLSHVDRCLFRHKEQSRITGDRSGSLLVGGVVDLERAEGTEH